MPYCGIAGCNTGNARIPEANKYQSFNLPKSNHIKEKWLERIKLNRTGFVPSNHTVVCEKHFHSSDFISDAENLDRRGKTKKKRKLRNTAVPSLFMSGDSEDISDFNETWNCDETNYFHTQNDFDGKMTGKIF